MTLEEMKQKKAEYRLTGEMIARESGVPLGTVLKIFSGFTKEPRKQTMEAIEKVFLQEEARKRRTSYDFSLPATETLRESSAQYRYGNEKLHTIDDYYALPEDVRVELIDGKYYYMTAPTRKHQMVLGRLHALFLSCADAHDLPCDVRLDRDDYTMVQPDILVLCNEDNTEVRRVEGAPELVVEILSPSTRMKDQLLKLHKYQNAGVREYWIVDIEHRIITVHVFQDEDYCPERYDFSDTVPIRISEGRCSIDFSIILDRLEKHGW